MTQPNICQRCGATLKPNDRFCRACGTTVAEARETNPAPTVKRRLSWKIWAGLGVLVLLLITMATLMIIDMRLFFKVASLFGHFSPAIFRGDHAPYLPQGQKGFPRFSLFYRHCNEPGLSC